MGSEMCIRDRFIDGRDKRIALQGKPKIVGVLTSLSSEEIYIEIAQNIDKLTRSSKLFQSLVKVLREAFRRVMLSTNNATDYVRLFRELNFNPQSWKASWDAFSITAFIIKIFINIHPNASSNQRCWAVFKSVSRDTSIVVKRIGIRKSCFSHSHNTKSVTELMKFMRLEIVKITL